MAKVALENPEVELVAVNDLGNIENLAYLLRYDSAYGCYDKEVKLEDGNLKIGDKEIKVFSQAEPAKLPWGELEIDVVIESTGFFKDREAAGGHLKAGAKKVIISAPTKDESIKTIVLGCNQNEIEPEDQIISMASCTTNCVAPMAKVLDDNFGIEKSLMSTIHSYTSTQNLVDGPNKKDFRRGRAAARSVIPASTGAAIAATKTLPNLKGKFDGMAYRVPTLVGSVSDMVVLLKKEVDAEAVNQAFRTASEGDLKDVMRVIEEPLVSADIVGDRHSVVVQLEQTKVVDGNLVKVVGWYDNERGYSTRLVDVAIMF